MENKGESNMENKQDAHMGKLNYAIMSLCFPNMFEKTEDFIELAKRLGIRGIDWCRAVSKGNKPEYIKHLCADNGIAITGFIPWTVALPNGDPNGWDDLKADLEFAAAIGAPMSLVPTPSPTMGHPKMTRPELQKFWMEALSRSTPLCKSLGIVPLVESFAGGPGPFITANELIECKRQIPDLEFAFDPGNMITAGVDPIEEYHKLRQVAPVRYAHFKEVTVIQEPSDENTGADGVYDNGYLGLDGHCYKEVPFGEGIMDHQGLIKTLLDDNYTGWVNIEVSARNFDHAVKYLLG